jgi:hypothetical protein
MTATARHLAALPEDARRNVLAGLSEAELQSLEFSWEFWARPDQLPPDGDWRTWAMISGRGAGKTRAAGEYVRAQVEAGRFRSIAIVGPTAAAIRRDQIEGGSGLLAISPPWFRPEYQPSSLEQRAKKPPVSQPVFRRHPITGRFVLYANAGYTMFIDGMDEQESGEILAFLFRHQEHAEYPHAHRWSVGDIPLTPTRR